MGAEKLLTGRVPLKLFCPEMHQNAIEGLLRYIHHAIQKFRKLGIQKYLDLKIKKFRVTKVKNLEN